MPLALGLALGLTFGQSQSGGDALDIILGAGGLDYAFFDFTATDRLFQENTGPTPADDIGEAIGLVIGRAKQGGKTFAQVMAGQPDLVAPAGAWVSVSNAILSQQTDNGFRMQSDPADPNVMARKLRNDFVVGRSYEVRMTLTSATMDSAAMRISTLEVTATADILNVALTAGVPVIRYFTATATTIYFGVAASRAPGDVNVKIDGFAIREVPAHVASQAGGSLKPVLQAAGAKFDGSDDRLKSDVVPGKVIIAQFTSPASLGSAAGLVAGSAGVSGANCFQLGVDNTGKLVGGAGGQSFTTIVGNNASILGVEAIAAIWAPGTGQTLKMFCDAAEVYSAAQFGAVSTTNVVNIGNRNINGADDRYFGGHVKRVAFGSPASFTLAEFQQIRSQWLAA